MWGAGLWGAGGTPSRQDVIDYVTIATLGNAVDFGNLSSARDGMAGFASPTRGVVAGGEGASPYPARDIIEFVTIASTGNASNFGDLKYPPDFETLDYVNPTAPKGGEISTWAFGTFDSLNRFIIKGNAANSGNIFIETLMTGTADEPDALYGLIAESIEYPENRSYAIFNIRPEARFSDGSKITARRLTDQSVALIIKEYLNNYI